MKQETVIELPCGTLFSTMANGIKTESGKAPRKGGHWTKNGTDVKITEWEENRLYEAVFSKKGTSITCRYELEPVDENHVKVTYGHTLSEPGWAARRKEKAACRKAVSLLKKLETALRA